jgi:hypothetical protein
MQNAFRAAARYSCAPTQWRARVRPRPEPSPDALGLVASSCSGVLECAALPHECRACLCILQPLGQAHRGIAGGAHLRRAC